MFRQKPWRLVMLLAFLLMIVYVREYMKEEHEQEVAIQQDKTEAAEEKQVHEAAQSVPDFAAIADVAEKKKAFFDYFYALVVAENQRILAERHILKTQDRNSAAVKRLCIKYSSDCNDISRDQKRLLLKRIDVIPPALALAQAAKESGWGGSRFALEANNYFGQWCYRKGCGLVPNSRIEGAAHEVRKFDNPQQSVRSYLFNLNTGKVYIDLRNMRLAARNQEKPFYGYDLAASLLYYSERREAYVEEVQSFIRYNNLSDYDQDFWQRIAQE